MQREIRTFQPGDEATQAAIYNAAAAKLPGFKPSTSEEVRRRTSAPDFDSTTRWFAVEGGKIVGYCMMQPNGRIGYPWCLPGHAAQDQLFNAAINACRSRNLKRIFAAYRADWTEPTAFFTAHGFSKTREMVNFVQGVLDLPTMVIRRGLNVTPLSPEDLPALAGLAPSVMRLPLEKLSDYFFKNPYFDASSLFCLRKSDSSLQAVGIMIANAKYADPLKIDPAMPCFRLGAFGTEGMTTKRVNGLFSFLVGSEADAFSIGLDLLSYAINNLEDDSVESLAAQAPSDAPNLVGFYQRHFRKQGSFPIFEREI